MKISDELFNFTFKNRIPLYSTIEVTYNCNLNCVHCYIPKYYRIKKVLSAELIKKTIAEISKLGGLYVVFTGGEPLLREDIFELIKYAKKLNFVVLLFTNGTLIDSLVAKKLKFFGVDKVEISLYGKEISYNKITRSNSSFNRVFSAIKYLKDNKVKVAIKCPIMKQNYDGYEYLKNIAKSFGIECKFDFVLTPQNDGNKSVQRFMITKEQMRNFLSFKKNTRRTKNIFSNLICSAGRNIVGISAEGNVYPCLQFPLSFGNINQSSFKKIWNSGKMLKLSEPEYSKFKKCKSCNLINVCNRCPGLAYIESKDIYGCSITAQKLAKMVS